MGINFTMSRHSGSPTCFGIVPDGMRTAFPHENTSVFADMFYKVNLLHKRLGKHSQTFSGNKRSAYGFSGEETIGFKNKQKSFF